MSTSPLNALQAQELAVAQAIHKTADAVRSMGSPLEAAMADLHAAIELRRQALAATMSAFTMDLMGLADDYGHQCADILIGFEPFQPTVVVVEAAHEPRQLPPCEQVLTTAANPPVERSAEEPAVKSTRRSRKK